MYVVIAEDTSDFKCLKILIKRLEDKEAISVEGKGFGSCGNMMNKGAKFLNSYNEQNKYRKLIICHDRDENSYQGIYEKVVSKIIDNAKIKSEKLICILIPTEEIEAWILADIKAVSKVIPSWQPKDEYPNPEGIKDPKETLIRLSRVNKPKPLYSHNTHNEQVMKHIDLEMVKKKCPSFAELAEFVESDISNYPKRKTK
jgi:hypothetical protein